MYAYIYVHMRYISVRGAYIYVKYEYLSIYMCDTRYLIYDGQAKAALCLRAAGCTPQWD